ncbi:mannosyl-oligosaccharide alpha-1,2-mannosidase [Arachnomyces sp. PD_36]|nr:mannosyl-oligosaccharide alpha-1,2-mannosidase [Arachnomyces sp. PD_36]
MSFQLPSKVPAFDSSQRPLEDGYWSATTSSAHGGFASKFKPFGDSDRDLPMYKDKPYFAPKRTGPAAERRRRRRLLWIIIGLAFLGLVWWLWSGPNYANDFIKGQGFGIKKGGDLWKWMKGLEKGESDKASSKNVDWEARREKVRDAFIVSWDSYEKHGWGYDEYKPISKTGRHMVEGGMGWIIVDALDTLMIMNLTSRVQNARNWIHTSLHYDQKHAVNTFETTIRMLGGLLSAHYLSTNYPDLAPISDDDKGAPGEDLYIEKATDLAERLLGAFDTESGIPTSSLYLNTSEGIVSHTDGGAASTAEAATVQLEFKYLAKLTGEPEYWEVVENVMKVVDDNEVQDGLVPIYIKTDTGAFKSNNIRLGSRGDSYYEYLIKQYLQTSKQEPIYLEMWDEALVGIRKHLIAYTKEASLTILGERPNGLERDLVPKMDHLVCFMPGTIALGVTGGIPLSEAKKSSNWGQKQEEEMLLARELMKTCWATYLATATGLAAEITYFKMDSPPRMEKDVYPHSTWLEGSDSSSSSKGEDLPLFSQSLYPLEDMDSGWRKDIDIHSADRHNLQRPETVESLFYMYRITGDETYRHWGWEMFKNFIKHTAVINDAPSSVVDGVDSEDINTSSYIEAFTSLSNANVIPPVMNDNMESFWLAETLKYFYLLFSDRDFLPLESTVFNTEAHIFPRFEMGPMLKTGWSRKQPRKWKESASSSEE